MTVDTYRTEVERLLQEIGDRMHELRVAKVRGARGAALRGVKEELHRTRSELAAITAASSS